MEMKINYIKFSFSSSYPSLNFIESNFIKKRSIFIGSIYNENKNYRCTLMKNLCFVNFTGVKSTKEILKITKKYCELVNVTVKSKIKIDSMFSTVNNVFINVNDFDKLNKNVKQNNGYLKIFPSFSGIYFKFNDNEGCGIYFKKSKKLNLFGQKHISNILKFVNLVSSFT